MLKYLIKFKDNLGDQAMALTLLTKKNKIKRKKEKQKSKRKKIYMTAMGRSGVEIN